MLLQEFEEVFSADAVINHLTKSKTHSRIAGGHSLQFLNGRPGVMFAKILKSSSESACQFLQNFF